MADEQILVLLQKLAKPDWLTLVAIALGPVLAVVITRIFDVLRDRRERRYRIFKDLMTTRSAQRNYEHVKALNAVEIEFNNKEKIMEAFKEYYTCLKGLGGTSFSALNKEEKVKFCQEKQQKFARLVHMIAKFLGVNIEQFDVLNGGYTPQGWVDDENEQRLLRQSLLKLLNHEIPFPVSVFNINTPQNFE